MEDEKSPPKETEITVEFVGHEEEGPQEVPGGGEFAESAAEGAPREDPEARIAELQDLCLRQRADFLNFKKRMDREREGHRRDAAAEVVLRILPVLDNLDRALKAMEGGGHPEWCQGFLLVRQQLWEALQGLGVEEIEALERPFDPVLHEAMAAVPAADVPPGTVVEVLERGYRMEGKILKPARVAVSAAGEAGVKERGEGHV